MTAKVPQTMSRSIRRSRSTAVGREISALMMNPFVKHYPGFVPQRLPQQKAAGAKGGGALLGPIEPHPRRYK